MIDKKGIVALVASFWFLTVALVIGNESTLMDAISIVVSAVFVSIAVYRLT